MITRTTISLNFEDNRKLKEIAKKEHRPISRQIVHMMEFYDNNNREI